MELSSQDNFRINVLLSQNMKAVRIDESKMVVYALTDRGEAKVPLNPNCKDEKYIKLVKAALSTHVMGSPGGYPVFLKRWTRMGQARDESLAQLLLLGEEEAVVAAVHAAGLTDELAERAWWAMPTAENARRMLEKRAVVEGKTGPVLAEFLIEYLPFEEEQRAIIESVRLVLQPGLVSEEHKMKLWNSAKAKRSFLVGFLHSLPDALPEPEAAHPLYDEVEPVLRRLHDEGNALAGLLLRVLDAQGQKFVQTAENALRKPSDQEVVESLLNAIAAYFNGIRPQHFTEDDIDAIAEEAECWCRDDGAAQQLIAELPQLREAARASRVLSCLGVRLVNPIFARTDAIGSVMRKKLAPLTTPLFEQLAVLRGR